MNVNKKLWSFIFGCLIAASFVWLISLGKSFDVIEYFHQYPEFVVDYYALMITAIATAFLTLFIVLIMKWVFNLLPREHPFWLILPSLTFVGLSFFTSKLMVVSCNPGFNCFSCCCCYRAVNEHLAPQKWNNITLTWGNEYHNIQ